MLNKIIDQDEIKKIVSHSEEIVLKDEVVCKIVIQNSNQLTIKNNNGHKVNCSINDLLSIKLLSNQNWVQIDVKGIYIYTINENKLKK